LIRKKAFKYTAFVAFFIQLNDKSGLTNKPLKANVELKTARDSNSCPEDLFQQQRYPATRMKRGIPGSRVCSNLKPLLINRGAKR
jgi:hypothetical protein